MPAPTITPKYPINFGGGSYTTNDFQPTDTTLTPIVTINQVAGTQQFSLAPDPQTTSPDSNTYIIVGAAAFLLLLIIMK